MKILKTLSFKKLAYTNYNTSPGSPEDQPDDLTPGILFKDKIDSEYDIKKKWKRKGRQEGVKSKNIYQRGVKVPSVDEDFEIPKIPF